MKNIEFENKLLNYDSKLAIIDESKFDENRKAISIDDKLLTKNLEDKNIIFECKN